MVPFRRAVLIALLLVLAIFCLHSRYSSAPVPHGTITTTHHKPSTTTSTPPVDPPPKDTPPPAAAAIKPLQQQRLTISHLRTLPLTDQLTYQYPYTPAIKFPAYIWQTWKYTPADSSFSEKFRISEASWTSAHPGFVHEVITDEVAAHLVHHLYAGVPDVLDAYTAMPLPILKADFFRYLILFARGGIYADIDTFALKPAIDWVDLSLFKMKTVGLVLGIEADPDRPDWADWYSRRIQFCQWTIQAKPGHPVLAKIIAKITEETLKRKREGRLGRNHDDVVEWTGPAVWTDAVFEYFNDPDYFLMGGEGDKNVTFEAFTGMQESKQVGDVVVLPITAFSPGVGHSGAGEPDDPMACVQHEFEGSWKPDSERHIEPAETPEGEAPAAAAAAPAA